MSLFVWLTRAACAEKEAQLEAQLKSRMAEFQEQCSQECKRRKQSALANTLIVCLAVNALLAEGKARVSLYEKALEKASVDLGECFLATLVDWFCCRDSEAHGGQRNGQAERTGARTERTRRHCFACLWP